VPGHRISGRARASSYLNVGTATGEEWNGDTPSAANAAGHSRLPQPWVQTQVASSVWRHQEHIDAWDAATFAK
jgi:hypothetical protein